MKKALLISLLLATSTSVLADTNSSDTKADPEDPCVMVTCLSGKLTGDSGGDDCDAAEGNFFKIVEKKHGDFLPDHTAQSRLKKLNQCASAPGDIVTKIISKFGRMM